MLILGSQLIGVPIMSLQTGSLLAETSEAIINPANLKVVAYEVTGELLDENPSLLLVSDVRELSNVGMIINSSDEFVGVEDVIKLKPLYDLKFSVINKKVIDQHNKKIGKVIDYTVDSDSFVIQQLNVRRPLLKSLNDAEFLVHRAQIVEINDKAIIIKTAKVKKSPATKTDKALEYVNPFRQNTPQPEAVKIDKS